MSEERVWADWEWGELPALRRTLGDGREVGVVPFLFTWAVIVGRDFDSAVMYEDRWCYRSLKDAVAAGTLWDGEGEPEGWHRHPSSGRRRDDGKVEGEYVNP